MKKKNRKIKFRNWKTREEQKTGIVIVFDFIYKNQTKNGNDSVLKSILVSEINKKSKAINL